MTPSLFHPANPSFLSWKQSSDGRPGSPNATMQKNAGDCTGVLFRLRFSKINNPCIFIHIHKYSYMFPKLSFCSAILQALHFVGCQAFLLVLFAWRLLKRFLMSWRCFFVQFLLNTSMHLAGNTSSGQYCPFGKNRKTGLVYHLSSFTCWFLLLTGFQTPLFINQPMGKGHLWLWEPTKGLHVSRCFKHIQACCSFVGGYTWPNRGQKGPST